METKSAQNRNQVLERKIQILEHELAATKKSFSFRLGQVLVEAARSPLRRGLLLPIHLFQLIKSYFTKSTPKNKAPGEDIQPPGPGFKVRNQKQYSRPGREEHKFQVFDNFQPMTSRKNSSLCIACMGDEYLLDCLEFEADIIRLYQGTWKTQLEERKPDFLLAQSVLSQGQSENGTLAAITDWPELKNILFYCRKKGIPTVFWDTEDSVHVSHFISAARLFDRVFAADPQSVSRYQELLSKPVDLLPPAVQPALHNPLKQAGVEQTECTLLFDGWSDILEYPTEFDFLILLLDKGLHIVESRYRLVANKLDDLPRFRENIMGCITKAQLLNALRHYSVLIMPEKTLSSSLSRSWRALEAVACGCSVVANTKGLGRIVDEFIVCSEDNESFQEKILQLLGDERERTLTNLVARRKIFSAHTYAHRIKQICQSVGIRHDWEEHPLVSVVTPTKRPDLISSCLEQFQKQSYPNKELIIIVNRSDVDFKAIQVQAEKFSHVRVYQIHEEKNIGTCLNFALSKARGKYWFKMDDDDFYGRNYLMDMVHLAESADFHIIGKPTSFIYLEKDHTTYLRNRAFENQHRIGNTMMPHLCGATLGGKRKYYTGFSEEHRACVDSGFVDQAMARNEIIISSDIWNFNAFRATDKNRHTWRHNDDNIIQNSTFFAQGTAENEIMV
jgi:hypothetical protein